VGRIINDWSVDENAGIGAEPLNNALECHAELFYCTSSFCTVFNGLIEEINSFTEGKKVNVPLIIGSEQNDFLYPRTYIDRNVNIYME
jgi:hypothetical protein